MQNYYVVISYTNMSDNAFWAANACGKKIAELRAIARRYKIRGFSTMNKESLIYHIVEKKEDGAHEDMNIHKRQRRRRKGIREVKVKRGRHLKRHKNRVSGLAARMAARAERVGKRANIYD